jgi:RNA polymerase sigma factor (sigma-70 family)
MATHAHNQFIPQIIRDHRDEVEVLDRRTQTALLLEVSRGRLAAERLDDAGLTEQERRSLTASVRKGQRAKDRLIVSNLRLVASIARRAARRGTWMSIDDLTQEGMRGLSHAIDKFDASLGHALSTYATWWIRQTIDRAILNSGLVRIPIHAQTNEATRRNPEIRQFDWFESIESILEAQRAADEAEAASDEAWVARCEQPALASNSDDYERVDACLMLRGALSVLSEREAHIIRRRFGLGCEAVTLEVVAQDFALTRERVRQIEKHAIERLRAHLGANAADFALAA